MSDIIDPFRKRQVYKPGELEMPLHNVSIPENQQLNLKIDVPPYEVHLVFRNRGYHFIEDEYRFQVGHVIIDTRPQRSNDSGLII